MLKLSVLSVGMAAAALVLSVAATSATAGVIAPRGSTSGPGLGDVQVIGNETGAPNNFDYTGQIDENPNAFALNKRFDHVGLIDTVVGVDPSDGITDYAFGEIIRNRTEVTWTDYHLELGFGSGSDFVRSASDDGLSFDYNAIGNAVTRLDFGTFDLEELNLVDGVVDSGDNFTLIISLDIPDGIDEFTIRQFPTVSAVDEPGLMWLMMASAAGFALLLHRRAAS